MRPSQPTASSAPSALAALALLAAPSACSRSSPEPPRPVSAPAPTPAPTPPPTARSAPPAPDPQPVRPLPPTTLPAPARLVALGDVHGDLEAFRAVLRLAGAIDEHDHWSGGPLVVVQTGDLLDRGDGERAIVDTARRLSEEAARVGGALLTLNGNHELMNVAGDFRYVTPGGYAAFADFTSLAQVHGVAPELPSAARGRAAAFAPGGPYARRLAEHNTVQRVGDTLFVHGGLLPAHVDYGLDAINQTVRAWMLGETRALPALLEREDSPVWLRVFAGDVDPDTCAVLARTLEQARARRLVIGHTVQPQGISSACGDRVWRIDVGLAHLYGGPTEALEITGERVRVLRAGAASAAAVAR